MRSNFLRLLSYLPIQKILNWAEAARQTRLRREIKACGRGVVISYGFHVDCPGKLTLADNVSFSINVSILGCGGVSIGRDSMLAAGVMILTTTHDSRATQMKQTGIHRSVQIGEGAWIGAGAIILPGVTIGNNAIIGAGAVVTKNVDSCAVAVGSPAQTIRFRDVPTES